MRWCVPRTDEPGYSNRASRGAYRLCRRLRRELRPSGEIVGLVRLGKRQRPTDIQELERLAGIDQAHGLVLAIESQHRSAHPVLTIEPVVHIR